MLKFWKFETSFSLIFYRSDIPLRMGHFIHLLFGCLTTNYGPLLQLHSPDIIHTAFTAAFTAFTAATFTLHFINFPPKVWEYRSEGGSLSLAECLLGFQLGFLWFYHNALTHKINDPQNSLRYQSSEKVTICHSFQPWGYN